MKWLAALAVVGCSLYALLAWRAWQTGWRYPFFEQPATSQPAYGFFPNRNHTAGFLLTGAILSLGLIHRGLQRGGYIFSIIAAPCFTLLIAMLLFFSASRGGLVFLVIGIMLWLLGLGRYRSVSLITAGLLVLCVSTFLFLHSGSTLLDRLRGQSHQSSSSAQTPRHDAEFLADARIGIARDTLSMVFGQPLSGTGMGTYALVYPFYADKSLRDQSTALHAESDWLTLAAEGGVPAVILVFGVVALLSIRIPQLMKISGNEWPLRWAFLSAFFAELLHGFVDVPLHKPELGWWVMLLGGIGFCSPASSKGGDFGATTFSRSFQRIIFISGGGAMFLLGILMIVAQWGGGPSMPPFAIAKAQSEVLKIYGDGSDHSAVNAAAIKLKQTILRYPLSHDPYYQLGTLLLNTSHDAESAKKLFRIGQALWPRDPNLPFEQGKAIALYEPLVAADYWNEALARQLYLDQLPTSSIPRSKELFARMITDAAGNQALLYRMPALAEVSPTLKLVWLISPSCDAETLASAIQDNSFFSRLSPKEQAQLLQLWWDRGDRKAVAAFLESHPEITVPGATVRASLLVSSGQPEQACKLLMETFGISVREATAGTSLIQAADSDVPQDSLAAAKYYLEHGNIVAARHDLGAASKEGRLKDEQAEILLLKARIEMSSGNWAEAVPLLSAYLHVTGRL